MRTAIASWPIPKLGYYAIGAKSYGRAPNFLMATGYEQARSVVAALAGDLVAADDVQLELPETGVCSASFPPTDVAATTPDAAAARPRPNERVLRRPMPRRRTLVREDAAAARQVSSRRVSLRRLGSRRSSRRSRHLSSRRL